MFHVTLFTKPTILSPVGIADLNDALPPIILIADLNFAFGPLKRFVLRLDGNPPISILQLWRNLPDICLPYVRFYIRLLSAQPIACPRWSFVADCLPFGGLFGGHFAGTKNITYPLPVDQLSIWELDIKRFRTRR